MGPTPMANCLFLAVLLGDILVRCTTREREGALWAKIEIYIFNQTTKETRMGYGQPGSRLPVCSVEHGQTHS